MKILVAPAISVAGRPATPLGRPLEGYTPPEDATAVRLLKEFGAELAHPQRSSELAFGLAGDATAETLIQTTASAALLPDTLGEVRLAAAAAGLVGYKPSWGIFSRSGLIGLVPSMECPGIIARELSVVKELSALLAVPDGADFSMLRKDLPDFSQSTPPSRPPALGLIRECLTDLLPGEKAALDRAVELLTGRGCNAREVSLPDYDLFTTVHRIVGSVEASSAAGNYDGVRFGHRAGDTENWNEMYLKTRGEDFSFLIKSYLFQGAYFQFEDYGAFESAARIRRRLFEESEKLWPEIDLLVLPALRPGRDPRKAKTVAETYEAFRHTLPANVLGLPAVTLSDLAFAGDRDLGLQLLGPPLSDARLLNFAVWLNDLPVVKLNSKESRS